MNIDNRISFIKNKCEIIKPVVVIKCIAFNHSKYIRHALEAFVSQETNFPFVAIIHDDASTDSTADIIKEFASKYPNIILPIFEQENQWSKKDGSLSKLMNDAVMVSGAKYVALCEGDDYWIDNKKLQIQYDFMEHTPDCTLCFHSVKEIYEDAPSKNKIRSFVENREYSGLEWYKNRPSQTASFFFRAEILCSELANMVYSPKSRFIAMDVPLLLTCSSFGKLFGIDKVMSVYRHNNGGWTSQKRSVAETCRIINSQLAYEVFGPSFKEQSIRFYQRECAQAFLSNLHRGKIRLKFLRMSIDYSLTGTIVQLFRVVNQRFHNEFKG